MGTKLLEKTIKKIVGNSVEDMKKYFKEIDKKLTINEQNQKLIMEKLEIDIPDESEKDIKEDLE
jgi:hypothetical protein